MPSPSLMRLLRSERMGEIIRFAIVGVVATLVHYAIYLTLQHWTSYNVAYPVGYLVSLACNFYLSSVFTFRSKPSVKKGLGFVASHAFNLLFQMALLNLFVWLGEPERWAPIPVWCITIPTNYLLVRFALRDRSQSRRADR